MGYSHGIQWTEDLVKEKILEVVRECGLDRMPSRNEVEQYYNNSSLTSQMSRNGGWTYYATLLNLPIKKSETYFGKQQEAIALEQLVSKGYEVRRMSQNFPYDLLVNDCLKVDVKASRLYRGEHGNFYSFNLEKPYCTCDIYLLYLLNDDRSTKDTLVIPSVFVSTNTQIGVGEKMSKYFKYSQKWDYIRQYVNFFESVA